MDNPFNFDCNEPFDLGSLTNAANDNEVQGGQTG